ncbi:MAG: helix-hairpin-helix domain-containing protein [Bdellovibrionales bacterium]|nr:helix-hairpin-helix domain-containing protein [Bdellovibrionales bacterium]
MMNLQTWIQTELPEISLKSADSVLNLTAEGATIPFIARYRKEATGGLDEVQIQKVIDAKESFDTITHRQTFILGEIEKQGKLTDELKTKILSTFQPNLLEDLYLPYKVKKKSKATLAKEAGLLPLADWIWDCGHGLAKPEPGQSLELWAFTFRNEEKGFVDAEKCIQGATDILVERLSERADLRARVRDRVFREGTLKAAKAAKAKPNSKYEMYFKYQEPLTALLKSEASHRYLAIRRGWMEEELTIGIAGPAGEVDPFETELPAIFEAEAVTDKESPGTEVLLKAARIAFKAHVLPAIENEAHKKLKEIADETAIDVFAQNVKKLLLASPFGPKAVLGVDPGIRTGCKVAVVSDSGKFVGDTVLHLQTDDGKSKAKEFLGTVLKMGDIKAIAVGNGTAGRETEAFVRQTVKETGVDVPVVMVSEAGASVYSASEVAREEFPDLDLTIRGAISIARRLQDPLAELVKVEPKSIGVGQYQHDVSPNALKKSLELVVDTCVNSVGVNLNTASKYLLSRVSGIGPGLAQAIVEYRGANGLFKSRAGLLEVPRFSAKTYEQAAGFLRIPESDDPLDNTGVHPERYSDLTEAAAKLGKSVKELMGSDGVRAIRDAKDLAKGLLDKLGEFTFEDVLKELEKPGRDPRDAFVPFAFRDDIFAVKDLQPAMICPGIVTNVTNFGAFVDIGVHQDGLVHISQISNTYVKDPRDVVSPGDRVTVKVLEVNLEKNQISLTMKTGEKTEGASRRGRGKDGKQAEGGGGKRSRRPKKEDRPAAPLTVKNPTLSFKESADGKATVISSPNRAANERQDRQDRGAGASLARSDRPRGRPGDRDDRGPRPDRGAPREHREEMKHNPFAGLAGLKGSLKR